MSPFSRYILVLVLASTLAPCDAFAAQKGPTRSAFLVEDTGPADTGRLAAHERDRYAPASGEETRRHEFIPVLWGAASNIPFSLELLVAFMWVGLVASAPVLLRYLDGKPITGMAAKFALALWGGTLACMYLFTNIVLFQSERFDGVRSLTLVECIYFMSQVVTTVGYGDITPAKPGGQLFVGCYIVCALSALMVLASQLLQHVQTATQRPKEVEAAAREEARQSSGDESEDVLAAVALKAARHGEPYSLRPLASSLLLLGLFTGSWAVFFRLWPGEDKSWADALYMSVITLSTVGFGTVTPATEGGMIFAAFWMLFGGAALVCVVTDLTSLMVRLKQLELQGPEDMQQSFSRFAASLDGDEVTEADFIRWGLMQQGLVAEEDLGDIKQGYLRLAFSRDGFLQGNSTINKL